MKASSKVIFTLFASCPFSLGEGELPTFQNTCPNNNHAKYNDGIYVGGTASCKEKSSYCCLDQDGNIGYTTACRNFSGVICHGNETHPTCLGQAACSNTTIGQIQPGNCNGDFACRDALIQEVIDGCNGLQACLAAQINGTVNGGCKDGDQTCSKVFVPGGIKENSCLGDYACWNATVGLVKDNSCVGKSACDSVVVNGTITSSSCRGDRQCANYLSNGNLVAYGGYYSSSSSSKANIMMSIILGIVSFCIL